jgi:hypothetical protein
MRHPRKGRSRDPIDDAGLRYLPRYIIEPVSPIGCQGCVSASRASARRAPAARARTPPIRKSGSAENRKGVKPQKFKAVEP